MLCNGRWFTATEVGTHNSVTDCWVTISGRVYDLTALFATNPPLLCEPIIMNAGKDISHWFEPRTFDMNEKEIDTEVLMWFHPTFRINQYYTPQVTHTPSKKYSHIHTQILKERK
jgi:cytochrome b involved in lipid metabolism